MNTAFMGWLLDADTGMVIDAGVIFGDEALAHGVAVPFLVIHDDTKTHVTAYPNTTMPDQIVITVLPDVGCPN